MTEEHNEHVGLIEPPEDPDSGRNSMGKWFENAFYSTRKAVERVLEPISRALPHPNIITGPVRTTFAIAGVATHTYSRILGTILYGLNVVCDGLDGMAARANNGERVTVEGEKFDPLIDKVTNAIALIHLSVQKIMATGAVDISDTAFMATAVANIAVDAYSQANRGPIGEQLDHAYKAFVHPTDCTPVVPGEKKRKNSANHWGKLKYAGQNAAIVGSMAASENEDVQIAATITLGISAVLGLIGTRLRKSIA